jgi:hypothetical protein
MKAGVRLALGLVAVSALVAVATGPAGASGPAKSNCETGAVKGADYVYKLGAHNLGCSKAVKLATKYNKCRHDHGGARGKCPSVGSYDCTTKKGDSSPEIYQATGKCTSGSKKFVEAFGELLH